MELINLKSTSGWETAITNNYSFKPYWWIRQMNIESQKALMQNHLHQMVENDASIMLGTSHDAELTGFATMHPLAWDTHHFGVTVWRLAHLGVWGNKKQQHKAAHLLAKNLVTAAVQKNAQTIHVWLPVDAIPVIHALEAVGFRTMVSQIYWLLDLQQQDLPAMRTSALLRSHTPQDTDVLVSIARTAFATIPNRFYADPNLPDQDCDNLYAQWIHNSCRGKAADYVSVVDVSGKAVGFFTLRFLNDCHGLSNVRMGQFVLEAIAPSHRHRGYHDDLMCSLLVWLSEREADIAFVGTQTNNIPAQIGMARLGFRPVCSGLSLHLWLN